MKKISKILSVILVILMVISIIPITASAAAPTSGTCGDNVTWEYDEVTNTLTISGEGPMYGYQADDYNDERPWITYDRCFELERIVINEGVTSVPYNAFVKCFKLSCVTLPASVTHIDENAFEDDSPILVVHYLGTEEEWNNVTICSGNEALLNAKLYCGDYKPTSASGTCGENLTWTFDADTFTLTISGTGAMDDFYTDYITDFRDPMDYIYDGKRPWETYKYEIKKVVISDGVTIIGNNAFRLFISLKEVEISNSVTEFNYRAFYDCDNLTDIYYSGTEEEWNSIGNNKFENVTIHYNPCTHEYNQTVTAPTCTEQGYTTYTCECGNSYVDDYVDALGHTEETIPAVEPTCTEAGLTDGVKCSVCDEVLKAQETVPATGHNYTSEITVPATHTATGVMTYTCTCGDSYTEVIEKLEKHNYETVVTAPTCTEQGYTTCTCECGDTYIADYVDELGHTEEIIPAVAPTCTETGLTEGAKCSVCGETVTEQKELPANGHSPANAVEENYVAPSCTADGSVDKVVYCSVCDEEISRTTETIEMLGHTDNDGDGYCDADNELLDPTVECDHACHKDGFTNLIWKIINFFNKLLGLNNTCSCGAAHY